MIDYAAIGRQIKDARLSRGMTQEKLAEKIGIGPSHMSHIESGKTVPSFDVFIALVNALEISADALLCREVQTARPLLNHWLISLVSDCDPVETKIIADTITALKDTLRKNKSTE